MVTMAHNYVEDNVYHSNGHIVGPQNFIENPEKAKRSARFAVRLSPCVFHRTIPRRTVS